MAGRIATGEITEELKPASGSPLWKSGLESARGKALTGGTHGHCQEGSGTALGMMGGTVPNDRDHAFAANVLSAWLTLISILVAVIIFLAIQYKDARHYATFGEPIHIALIGAIVLSG